MLYILVIGLGLVEIVFQLVVAPVFSIFTIFPNIILVTVVLLFVFLDFNFSMSFAFACGLVLDLFSRAPFGAITFSLFLCIVLIRLFSEKYISKHSLTSTLFLTVIATIVFSFSVQAIAFLAHLARISSYMPLFSESVTRDVPLLLVWSLLCVALLWRPFQKLAPVLEYFQHRAKNF